MPEATETENTEAEAEARAHDQQRNARRDQAAQAELPLSA